MQKEIEGEKPSYNRTILELKLLDQAGIGYAVCLIIAPYWN